jgi:hypothetical protein
MGTKGRIPTILHFLEPLSAADFADRKTMSSHCRTLIAETLGIALA